jgi:DNA-binding response OmpR family regulator
MADPTTPSEAPVERAAPGIDRERAVIEFNNLATAIVGHAQLALNNPTYECLRRSAQISSECARKMADMARSMLVFAATPPGVHVNSPLNALVDQVLKLVAARGPQAPARIVAEYECAALVRTDAALLRETLFTLLTRPLGPEGGGIVHVRTQAAGAGVNLLLHYSGMPTSDDLLRRTCAPLLAPAPSEPAVSATVETHADGSVLLTLALPVALAEQAARPARVLVVDDEPVILSIFSRIIARAGHTVDTASGGRVALDKLRANEYDVVLLDWMMPEVSGADVLREGRALRPGLPFVIITAAYSRPLATQAVALGAVECLGKPLNHRKVLHLVAKCTGRPAPVGEEGDAATEGRGEVLLVADPDAFHRNLYRLIFDHAGYACTVVANLEETTFAMKKEYFDAVLVAKSLLQEAGTPIRALRSLNPYTPVMIIGDHADEVQRQQSLSDGAAAFLERPLELRKFLQDIRTILDIYKEPGAGRQ